MSPISEVFRGQLMFIAYSYIEPLLPREDLASIRSSDLRTTRKTLFQNPCCLVILNCQNIFSSNRHHAASNSDVNKRFRLLVLPNANGMNLLVQRIDSFFISNNRKMTLIRLVTLVLLCFDLSIFSYLASL